MQNRHHIRKLLQIRYKKVAGTKMQKSLVGIYQQNKSLNTYLVPGLVQLETLKHIEHSMLIIVITQKFRVNTFPLLGILIGLGKRGQFFLSDFGPVYGRWKVPGDQEQAPDDEDQVPIDLDQAPDDQDQQGELDTPDEADESEDSISAVDSPKQLPSTKDEKVCN